MATLEQNIKQAIADFNDIEAAIEELGVDVPYGMDTKEYGNLIRQQLGLRITVDQNYNPESSNPQSGTAVAEALASQPIKYLESLDRNNCLNLYDLESGMYVLYGYFLVYPNATKRYTFSKMLFVAVSHGSISTCVQVLYPAYNTIQYLNIWKDENSETGYDFERKDAELYYAEDTRNKSTAIDETSDDEHYPSSKAVYDAISGNTLRNKVRGEIIRVDDVSPFKHTVKAKVKSKNLMPYPYFATSNSANGGTLAAREDGGIAVSGTPTDYVHLTLYNGASLTKEGKVTFSLLGEFENIACDVSLWDSASTVVGSFSFHVDNPYLTVDMSEYPTVVKWNVSIKRRYNNVEMRGIVYPQIELGDTATEYTPYVDPATVMVTRCGKNLYGSIDRQVVNFGDFAAENVRSFTGKSIFIGYAANNFYAPENVTYYEMNGSNVKVTSTLTGYGIGVDFKSAPNRTYHISGIGVTDNALTYSEYDENGTFLRYGFISRNKFTTGENTAWLVICFRVEGANSTREYKNVQLEVDGVTPFEEYKGTETYTLEADGTANGITSLSPTMTLFTDKENVSIEMEYNQDINIAFDGINALLEALLNGGA